MTTPLSCTCLLAWYCAICNVGKLHPEGPVDIQEYRPTFLRFGCSTYLLQQGVPEYNKIKTEMSNYISWL